MGKGENASNRNVFYHIEDINSIIWDTINMSFATDFKLDESKFLSFSKELNYSIQ